MTRFRHTTVNKKYTAPAPHNKNDNTQHATTLMTKIHTSTSQSTYIHKFYRKFPTTHFRKSGTFRIWLSASSHQDHKLKYLKSVAVQDLAVSIIRITNKIFEINQNNKLNFTHLLIPHKKSQAKISKGQVKSPDAKSTQV